MRKLDADKRIKLIEDITHRILLRSHIDDYEKAREIALRWAK